MQQLKTDIYLETFENNIFFRNNHYTINDNDNDTKRTVMVVNDEFAENEIKTTNILKTIKNYEFYFNIFQEIQDVKIGEEVISNKNGKGMITGKTKRTVTVTFQNGNVVKNTYRYSDTYFYGSDF